MGDSPILTPHCPPMPPSLPQEAESPKSDSSYDCLEEMEACEDKGCPGLSKSLSPKTGTATKGQVGDGPELTELPQASAPTPGTSGTLGMECNAEMELEKVRMEFELTRLKYLHEKNECQRQHEGVMAQLQQQAAPHLVGDSEWGYWPRGLQGLP